MIADFLGFFLICVWLTLIGAGPSIWLVGPARSVRTALALAPAAGLTIISLIAFPLVRYAAPVRVWAWPVGVALAVISLAVVAVDWRQRPQRYGALRLSSRDVFVLAGLLLSTLILASPLLLLGIQDRIFRTNPSDAFFYMSLADTLRAANWPTILGGLQLQNNVAGLAALTNASPTALLAARFILYPLALNTSAALAWMAEAARLPVTQAYFLQHLVSLAVAQPVAFVIAGRLTPSRLLRLLAAAAVALGFWAVRVLATDAGYELSVIPIGLLFVAAWIQLEQEPPQLWSRARVGLGVTLATVLALNFPLSVVLAGAFCVYYGLGFAQRLRPLSTLLYHGVTVLFVVVTLGVTGQLDYLFRSIVWVTVNSNLEAAYVPSVVNLIKADGLPAIWGMPESILLAGRQTLVRWPAKGLDVVLAVALTAGLLVTGLMALRKTASASERIVLALLAGSALVAIETIWQNNLRTTGKAFTYVYPYLILSVLLIPAAVRAIGWPRLQRAAAAVVGVWLAGQTLLGPYLTYSHARADALDFAITGASTSTTLKQGKNYDLSPIENYLEQHPPQELLIAIPRDTTWKLSQEEAWPFAYYAMFAFSRFPHYFQSGLIIDNSARTANLWLSGLAQVPDYAVVDRAVDYIGPNSLGVTVAQTANLVLYRITSTDLAVFNQHEPAFQVTAP